MKPHRLELRPYQQLLLRHGYDPEVPFAEASRIISALAANGWRALGARISA